MIVGWKRVTWALLIFGSARCVCGRHAKEGEDAGDGSNNREWQGRECEGAGCEGSERSGSTTGTGAGGEARGDLSGTVRRVSVCDVDGHQ